ncbi:hypothetical protein ACRS6P_31515, partial [Pseudomonas aeruginosa]
KPNNLDRPAPLCPMTEASPRPLELPASVETVD